MQRGVRGNGSPVPLQQLPEDDDAMRNDVRRRSQQASRARSDQKAEGNLLKKQLVTGKLGATTTDTHSPPPQQQQLLQQRGSVQEPTKATAIASSSPREGENLVRMALSKPASGSLLTDASVAHTELGAVLLEQARRDELASDSQIVAARKNYLIELMNTQREKALEQLFDREARTRHIAHAQQVEAEVMIDRLKSSFDVCQLLDSTTFEKMREVSLDEFIEQSRARRSLLNSAGRRVDQFFSSYELEQRFEREVNFAQNEQLLSEDHARVVDHDKEILSMGVELGLLLPDGTFKNKFCGCEHKFMQIRASIERAINENAKAKYLAAFVHRLDGMIEFVQSFSQNAIEKEQKYAEQLASAILERNGFEAEVTRLQGVVKNLKACTARAGILTAVDGSATGVSPGVVFKAKSLRRVNTSFERTIMELHDSDSYVDRARMRQQDHFKMRFAKITRSAQTLTARELLVEHGISGGGFANKGASSLDNTVLANIVQPADTFDDRHILGESGWLVGGKSPLSAPLATPDEGSGVGSEQTAVESAMKGLIRAVCNGFNALEGDRTTTLRSIALSCPEGSTAEEEMTPSIHLSNNTARQTLREASAAVTKHGRALRGVFKDLVNARTLATSAEASAKASESMLAQLRKELLDAKSAVADMQTMSKKLVEENANLQIRVADLELADSASVASTMAPHGDAKGKRRNAPRISGANSSVNTSPSTLQSPLAGAYGPLGSQTATPTGTPFNPRLIITSNESDEDMSDRTSPFDTPILSPAMSPSPKPRKGAVLKKAASPKSGTSSKKKPVVSSPSEKNSAQVQSMLTNRMLEIHKQAVENYEKGFCLLAKLLSDLMAPIGSQFDAIYGAFVTEDSTIAAIREAGAASAAAVANALSNTTGGATDARRFSLEGDAALAHHVTTPQPKPVKDVTKSSTAMLDFVEAISNTLVSFAKDQPLPKELVELTLDVDARIQALERCSEQNKIWSPSDAPSQLSMQKSEAIMLGSLLTRYSKQRHESVLAASPADPAVVPLASPTPAESTLSADKAPPGLQLSALAASIRGGKDANIIGVMRLLHQCLRRVDNISNVAFARIPQRLGEAQVICDTSASYNAKVSEFAVSVQGLMKRVIKGLDIFKGATAAATATTTTHVPAAAELSIESANLSSTSVVGEQTLLEGSVSRQSSQARLLSPPGGLAIPPTCPRELRLFLNKGTLDLAQAAASQRGPKPSTPGARQLTPAVSPLRMAATPKDDAIASAAATSAVQLNLCGEWADAVRQFDSLVLEAFHAARTREGAVAATVKQHRDRVTELEISLQGAQIAEFSRATRDRSGTVPPSSTGEGASAEKKSSDLCAIQVNTDDDDDDRKSAEHLIPVTKSLSSTSKSRTDDTLISANTSIMTGPSDHRSTSLTSPGAASLVGGSHLLRPMPSVIHTAAPTPNNANGHDHVVFPRPYVGQSTISTQTENVTVIMADGEVYGGLDESANDSLTNDLSVYKAFGMEKRDSNPPEEASAPPPGFSADVVTSIFNASADHLFFTDDGNSPANLSMSAASAEPSSARRSTTKNARGSRKGDSTAGAAAAGSRVIILPNGEKYYPPVRLGGDSSSTSSDDDVNVTQRYARAASERKPPMPSSSRRASNESSRHAGDRSSRQSPHSIGFEQHTHSPSTGTSSRTMSEGLQSPPIPEVAVTKGSTFNSPNTDDTMDPTAAQPTAGKDHVTATPRESRIAATVKRRRSIMDRQKPTPPTSAAARTRSSSSHVSVAPTRAVILPNGEKYYPPVRLGDDESSDSSDGQRDGAGGSTQGQPGMGSPHEAPKRRSLVVLSDGDDMSNASTGQTPSSGTGRSPQATSADTTGGVSPSGILLSSSATPSAPSLPRHGSSTSESLSAVLPLRRRIGSDTASWKQSVGDSAFSGSEDDDDNDLSAKEISNGTGSSSRHGTMSTQMSDQSMGSPRNKGPSPLDSTTTPPMSRRQSQSQLGQEAEQSGKKGKKGKKSTRIVVKNTASYLKTTASSKTKQTDLIYADFKETKPTSMKKVSRKAQLFDADGNPVEDAVARTDYNAAVAVLETQKSAILKLEQERETLQLKIKKLTSSVTSSLNQTVQKHKREYAELMRTADNQRITIAELEHQIKCVEREKLQMSLQIGQLQVSLAATAQAEDTAAGSTAAVADAAADDRGVTAMTSADQSGSTHHLRRETLQHHHLTNIALSSMDQADLSPPHSVRAPGSTRRKEDATESRRISYQSHASGGQVQRRASMMPPPSESKGSDPPTGASPHAESSAAPLQKAHSKKSSLKNMGNSTTKYPSAPAAVTSEAPAKALPSFSPRGGRSERSSESKSESESSFRQQRSQRENSKDLSSDSRTSASRSPPAASSTGTRDSKGQPDKTTPAKAAPTALPAREKQDKQAHTGNEKITTPRKTATKEKSQTKAEAPVSKPDLTTPSQKAGISLQQEQKQTREVVVSESELNSTSGKLLSTVQPSTSAASAAKNTVSPVHQQVSRSDSLKQSLESSVVSPRETGKARLHQLLAGGRDGSKGGSQTTSRTASRNTAVTDASAGRVASFGTGTIADDGVANPLSGHGLVRVPASTVDTNSQLLSTDRSDADFDGPFGSRAETPMGAGVGFLRSDDDNLSVNSSLHEVGKSQRASLMGASSNGGSTTSGPSLEVSTPGLGDGSDVSNTARSTSQSTRRASLNTSTQKQLDVMMKRGGKKAQLAATVMKRAFGGGYGASAAVDQGGYSQLVSPSVSEASTGQGAGMRATSGSTPSTTHKSPILGSEAVPTSTHSKDSSSDHGHHDLNATARSDGLERKSSKKHLAYDIKEYQTEHGHMSRRNSILSGGGASTRPGSGAQHENAHTADGDEIEISDVMILHERVHELALFELDEGNPIVNESIAMMDAHQQAITTGVQGQHTILDILVQSAELIMQLLDHSQIRKETHEAEDAARAEKDAQGRKRRKMLHQRRAVRRKRRRKDMQRPWHVTAHHLRHRRKHVTGADSARKEGKTNEAPVIATPEGGVDRSANPSVSDRAVPAGKGLTLAVPEISGIASQRKSPRNTRLEASLNMSRSPSASSSLFSGPKSPTIYGSRSPLSVSTDSSLSSLSSDSDVDKAGGECSDSDCSVCEFIRWRASGARRHSLPASRHGRNDAWEDMQVGRRVQSRQRHQRVADALRDTISSSAANSPFDSPLAGQRPAGGTQSPVRSAAERRQRVEVQAKSRQREAVAAKNTASLRDAYRSMMSNAVPTQSGARPRASVAHEVTSRNRRQTAPHEASSAASGYATDSPPPTNRNDTDGGEDPSAAPMVEGFSVAGSAFSRPRTVEEERVQARAIDLLNKFARPMLAPLPERKTIHAQKSRASPERRATVTNAPSMDSRGAIVLPQLTHSHSSRELLIKQPSIETTGSRAMLPAMKPSAFQRLTPLQQLAHTRAQARLSNASTAGQPLLLGPMTPPASQTHHEGSGVIEKHSPPPTSAVATEHNLLEQQGHGDHPSQPSTAAPFFVYGVHSANDAVARSRSPMRGRLQETHVTPDRQHPTPSPVRQPSPARRGPAPIVDGVAHAVPLDSLYQQAKDLASATTTTISAGGIVGSQPAGLQRPRQEPSYTPVPLAVLTGHAIRTSFQVFEAGEVPPTVIPAPDPVILTAYLQGHSAVKTSRQKE